MADNEDHKDKALPAISAKPAVKPAVPVASAPADTTAAKAPVKAAPAAVKEAPAAAKAKPVVAKPAAAKLPEAKAVEPKAAAPAPVTPAVAKPVAKAAEPVPAAPEKVAPAPVAAKPEPAAAPVAAVVPPVKAAAVPAAKAVKAPVVKAAKARPAPKPLVKAAPVAKPVEPVVPVAAVVPKPVIAIPKDETKVAAPVAVPNVIEPKAAPKTAPKDTPVFAGLFTNFLLEEKTMTSANFAGFQDAITEAQTKAKAAFEKSTSALGEVSDFAKGNVEAVVESGKIFAEGVQGFGSELVAESRSAFETMTGDIKELAAAKSPTDFFKLQSDLVRKNFDTAVANGSKNSEALLKLFSDTFAPISGRVSIAVEKARSVATPAAY